jgi:hypothetical protein
MNPNAMLWSHHFARLAWEGFNTIVKAESLYRAKHLLKSAQCKKMGLSRKGFSPMA